MYKHYIRINENYEIIHAFSSAFEDPLTNDILIKTTEERHFNLPLLYNDVIYKWKYIDGVFVEKKQEDLQALWKSYLLERKSDDSEIEYIKKDIANMWYEIMMGGYNSELV